MKRLAIIAAGMASIFSLLLACATTACCANILKIADGSTLTLAEMLDDLKTMRCVFVGETHDHPGHHRAQLQIIRGLKERGVRLAVGLEMFRADSQPALDRWIAGEMPLDEFVTIFNDNWSDWEQYQNIFDYALYAKIPLVGLNVERSIIRQVAAKGFGSLSASQLQSLPSSVTCSVEPAYERFIRKALGSHIDRDVPFQYFCEAQLLWDKVMAENLLDFLKANPGYAVVVLAGSGHAWKHGIPAQISKQSGSTFRVVLPETASHSGPDGITEADADYLLLGVDEAPVH